MLLVSSPESTAPRHSAVNEVQSSPPPCAAMRSDVSRFHRRHFTQDGMNTSQLTCSQPSSYPFWLPWKPAVVFSLLSAGWLVRDVRLLFLLAAWQNNPHSPESISSQTQRPGEETGKSWAGHRLSLIDCWTPPSQFADLTRCFHSNPHFSTCVNETDPVPADSSSAPCLTFVRAATSRTQSSWELLCVHAFSWQTDAHTAQGNSRPCFPWGSMLSWWRAVRVFEENKRLNCTSCCFPFCLFSDHYL